MVSAMHVMPKLNVNVHDLADKIIGQGWIWILLFSLVACFKAIDEPNIFNCLVFIGIFVNDLVIFKIYKTSALNRFCIDFYVENFNKN